MDLTTRERYLVSVIAALVLAIGGYFVVWPGLRTAAYIQKCIEAEACPTNDVLDKRLAQIAAAMKADAEAAVKERSAPRVPQAAPSAPIEKGK